MVSLTPRWVALYTFSCKLLVNRGSVPPGLRILLRRERTTSWYMLRVLGLRILPSQVIFPNLSQTILVMANYDSGYLSLESY